MSRQKKQHLKRQKDGRYFCKWHGVTFVGRTEDEALQKREAYKQSGRITVKRTLAQYAEYWLPIHKASVKSTTYNGYISILSCVLKPIADINLNDLTTDDISNAFAALKGKSQSYIHKARLLLIEILDSAVDAGFMPKNPARANSVTVPKGSRGTHRAITAAERKLILETPHRMRLAALLMLFCGLRRGEVIGLKASDINGDSVRIERAVYFVGNQPRISDTKTANGKRTVPAPDFILSGLPKMNRESFVLTGKSKPMTETAFVRAWESYLKALKAEIRPHDLRHSYCTWLRDCGIDIHQAIIWMGHADESMILRIYDHPGTERENEAKNRLNQALSSQNG
jgi:integrase